MLFSEKIEQLLLRLEKQRTEYWNIDRDSANLLFLTARAIKAKKILEIGTSTGYSGIWLAHAVRENQGRLFTVESHDGRYEMAKNNFQEAEIGDLISQIKGHAPEVLESHFEELKDLDMLFLDATKMEYLSYFSSLHPLLRKGGVLVADNVSSHQDALSDFRKAIEVNPNFAVQFVPVGTGMIFATKLT